MPAWRGAGNRLTIEQGCKRIMTREAAMTRVLALVLLAAAILGDTANYWLGKKLGAKVFKSENSKQYL